MIVFVESFSPYANVGVGGATHADNLNSLSRRWNSLSNATNLITTTVGARNLGSSCLSCQNGDSASITLPHQSRYIYGVAFTTNDITKLGTTLTSLNNLNPNGVTAAPLFNAVVTNTGAIQLKANSNNIATSSFTFTDNTYYYVEFDASLTFVSGNIYLTVQCWVNNILVVGGAASTGISSVLSNDFTFNSLLIGSPGLGGGSVCKFADMYVLDTHGANWVTRLGPVTKISLVHPASDQLANWTPSRVGTHFDLVNENPEDADATYVNSITPGQQDIYNYQTIPTFVGTIPAVQVSTCRRKTAQGLAKFATMTGANGSEDQSQDFYPGGNYVYDRYILQLDPNTMMPWTTGGFNTTPFGLKVT